MFLSFDLLLILYLANANNPNIIMQIAINQNISENSPLEFSKAPRYDALPNVVITIKAVMMKFTIFFIIHLVR